jgi:hypothetical protein
VFAWELYDGVERLWLQIILGPTMILFQQMELQGLEVELPSAAKITGDATRHQLEPGR